MEIDTECVAPPSVDNFEIGGVKVRRLFTGVGDISDLTRRLLLGGSSPLRGGERDPIRLRDAGRAGLLGQMPANPRGSAVVVVRPEFIIRAIEEH